MRPQYPKPGHESYKTFPLDGYPATRIVYRYRSASGLDFLTKRFSLPECRIDRDAWLLRTKQPPHRKAI